VLRALTEEEPGAAPPFPVYPSDRDRDFYRPGLITARFCRYESTKGFVNVADVFTGVLKFSSLPDSIEIFVVDFAAEIRFLHDRGGSNESITLSAGNFYEPGLVYEILEARNLAAGSVARVQVVGKWVAR